MTPFESICMAHYNEQQLRKELEGGDKTWVPVEVVARTVVIWSCAKCGSVLDGVWCSINCELDGCDHEKAGRRVKLTYRRTDVLVSRSVADTLKITVINGTPA